MGSSQQVTSDPMVFSVCTLKYAHRGNVARLVEIFLYWKSCLAMTMSQSKRLSSYVSVLDNGEIPALVEPVPYSGTNIALREKYLIDYKLWYNKNQEIPENNGFFINTVLKSCDKDLTSELLQSRKFKSFLDERPINIISAYNLILEKAICEPEHKQAMAINCRAFFSQIKMRHPGESCERFVSRFNDTHEFGVTYLNMFPVPDVERRTIFLASISKVPPIHEFWSRETVRTDVATTLATLQARLIEWSTLLKIVMSEPKKVSDSSVSEAPQFSLISQGSENRNTNNTNGNYKRSKNKSQPRKLKITGPRDQTDQDGRIAQNLVGPRYYDSPAGNLNSFQKYPPKNKFRSPRTNDGYNPPSRASPNRDNPPSGFPPQRGNPPSVFPPHRDTRENYSKPHANYNKPGGGNKWNRNPVFKKNLFSNNNDLESCYTAVVLDPKPFRSDDTIPQLESFIGDPSSDIEFLDAVSEGEDVGEVFEPTPVSLLSGGNLPVGPYRSRTALDSGSTFHVANDVIPPDLLVGPMINQKSEFKVQGILGKPVSLQLVTADHIVGEKCHVVPDAPMSLLSMGLLWDSHDMDTSKRNVLTFKPKKSNSTDTTLTFVKMDKLFILTRVVSHFNSGRQCLIWSSDDSSPQYGDIYNHDGQVLDTSVSLMSIEGMNPMTRISDKSKGKLVVGPTAYDHSPLLQKSYLDAVSLGDPTSIFTKRQINRAAEVKHLKLSMRGISDGQLRLMLSNSRIKGCHLSPKDVDNAREGYFR